MISPAILEALQLQALAIQKLIYYVATQQAVRKHEITTASRTPSTASQETHTIHYPYYQRQTPTSPITITPHKHQNTPYTSHTYHQQQPQSHPIPHTPELQYPTPHDATNTNTSTRTRTKTNETTREKTTKNTITKATGTRTIRTR